MENQPKYTKYTKIKTITGKVVSINSYGEKPYWSDYNKCWMYETCYGLGGTSFGYIRECDIIGEAKPDEIS
jgi:hypothetical protein